MATTQQREHDSLMWLERYSVYALDGGEKICFHEYIGWRSRGLQMIDDNGSENQLLFLLLPGNSICQSRSHVEHPSYTLRLSEYGNLRTV